MKSFIKSFFVAATAVLLLAGCSGINSNDATVSGLNGEAKTVLTININDIDASYVPAAKAARTINLADDDQYASDASFPVLRLTGETENQAKLKDADDNAYVDLTADSNGDYKVTLSSSVWYLTLSAYSDTAAATKVLEGKTRVDLRNATTASANFELKTDGVTTMGAVDITIKLPATVDATPATTKIKSAKIGLYNLNTNAIVSEDGVSSGFGEIQFSDAAKPGRYLFAVKYYNADDKVLGSWGDVIVVAPGRTTTYEETIPDIIAKAPEAPTDFHAYRINNSEDGKYYNVLFTWTRGSLKNEENYEITLNTYASATATDASSTKVYGVTAAAATASTPEKVVFFGNPDCVSGNLNAGSTSCIIRLETGKLYDVSIKACNFVGNSSDVARTEATASAAAPTGSPSYPTNTAYGASKINRVKVTYNLNGGIYTKTDGANTTKITGSVIKYDTFTSDAINLTDEMTADNLQKDSLRKFSGNWYASASPAASATPETTYTFENKTVYASYDFSMATITYSVVDSYGVISATASGATSTWTAASKTLEITANEDITFSVANGTGDDEILGIKFNIDSNVILSAESPSNEVVLSESELSRLAGTGALTPVTITVVKGDNKVYGDIIYLDIKRD